MGVEPQVGIPPPRGSPDDPDWGPDFLVLRPVIEAQAAEAVDSAVEAPFVTFASCEEGGKAGGGRGGRGAGCEWSKGRTEERPPTDRP